MRIITLLTDFGSKSGYVAQMKGVITSITPSARIIDITHDITPQNIREASFILKTTTPYFPVGSVHVVVVDPGVGTERRGIVVVTRKNILVGPDNGVLMPAAHQAGDFIVYEIKNREYMLNEISKTFHGRDVFAPVAAHILRGIPFESIGPRIEDYVDHQIWKAVFSDKEVYAIILHVDRFGNLVTNIDGGEFMEKIGFGDRIKLVIHGEERDVRFMETYGYAEEGEAIALIGSSGFLEISINQGDASKEFKVKPGDHLKISFS